MEEDNLKETKDMINPNKNYKQQTPYRILSISHNLEVVVVNALVGKQTIRGYLDHASNSPQRFKVGDLVRVSVRFSIMADEYTIASISKLRNQKAA